MNRIAIAFKALRQLGLRQVGLYALYKIGLATGHYRRTEKREQRAESSTLRHLFTFPTRDNLLTVLDKDDRNALLAEADEIVGGKVRLFGAEPVPLQLTLPHPLAHWTAYETGKVPLPAIDEPANLPTGDVKRIWEPARFGWAFTLGRAYHLSRDEKYAEAFWRNFETFTESNPPYLGPNWMSGQEAALRMMVFAWAGQVFGNSKHTTNDRLSHLAQAVAQHAVRITQTIIYARAQHNNHLLSEAAGLLTAGLALPGHPHAARWRALGWKWLNHGLQSQIDSYGEYAQHSTNYHRLMLQIVLWTDALLRSNDRSNDFSRSYRWPRPTLEAVRRSVHWLLSLMDSESGRTPNLGANDGAYIFPLTVCPLSDFRPVLHAAARAFLDYDLPRGPWDEMALWFGAQDKGPRTLELPRYLGDQMYGKESWGYLRTAQFTSRPSHADQLHFDLWWRGLNVARDAGTYLYNADQPWDNALAAAFVHNTVTVGGRDQFTRAGRFLYLDWADAFRKPLPVEETGELQRLRGRYRGRGYRHTRTVSAFEGDRWRVVDEILPLSWRRRTMTARLHWLLPDWEWRMENGEQKIEISLESPHGLVTIAINHSPLTPHALSLFHAGKPILGSSTPDPRRGWTSPTYGDKIPALSLALLAESDAKITFTTEFILSSS